MAIGRADLVLPELLGGRYRPLGLVGRGAIAEVVRARDEETGRLVALKILYPHLRESAVVAERFKREVEIVRRVRHPNVLAIHDVVESDGQLFLVMDFHAGGDLADLIARRGRLTPDELRLLTSQLCGALGAAHRAGVVHRDVKPSNVLVGPGPALDVRLCDFGLARTPELSGLTTANAVLGTPEYMAPEVITDGHADPRSDIYSLGVVLFEAATGKPPFHGDSPYQLMRQHVDVDAPRVGALAEDVPPALERAIARALAKDPLDRFAAAEDFARALGERLDHPYLVRVLDVGEEASTPFLVLELVRAETLRRVLDRLGVLTPDAARTIFAALAQVLDHAHAQGVLHRDIKPQNIFVSEQTVKLGDFGNARVVSLASVTGASLTWGTPEYVAPEVFMRGRADPRSDLYALGVVFYEMLTGRLPWTRAETLTRLGAASGSRPTLAPTGAGPETDQLIAALLSPSAADRPASGRETMARLEAPEITTLARKPSCATCGAPRPEDVPRCLTCGTETLRLRHDLKGRWRLVLNKLADDADATENLLRLLEPLVKHPGRPLQFLTGDRSLYSNEELRAGIAFPAVLMANLDAATARTLAAMCRDGGLDVRAYEGTHETTERSGGGSRGVWRAILPMSLMFLGLGVQLAHSWAVGVAFGVALFGTLGSAMFFWPRWKRLRRGAGVLELREDVDAQPVAEALLTGAARAAAEVRAPEVRALFADVATEIYRLTRRAEGLRAQAAGPSHELDVLERTIAAAPPLMERLRGVAAHLEALDDALAVGSEGELMQALGRLERSAGAPGVDRAALAETRREIEATLERRGAAEQERARLSAALCQQLGELRRITRRAQALTALDEDMARAVESAAAELEAFLRAAR